MNEELESPDKSEVLERHVASAVYSDAMLTECNGDPLLRSGPDRDLAASLNAVAGNSQNHQSNHSQQDRFHSSAHPEFRWKTLKGYRLLIGCGFQKFA